MAILGSLCLLSTFGACLSAQPQRGAPLLILGKADSPVLSKESEALLRKADEAEIFSWAKQQNLVPVKLKSGYLLMDEDALGILSLRRQAWTLSLMQKGQNRSISRLRERKEGEPWLRWLT